MKTLEPLRSPLALPGALLALAVLFAPPLASAQCDGLVMYRLWENDREVWYDHGETVQVAAGDSADLYLHVALQRSSTPYGTNADIGYPQEFDFDSVASKEVLKHVRMRTQSGDDRRQGRIQFTAQQPGTTMLGYVIESVDGRVDLDRLPQSCLRDQVRIEVVSSSAQIDDAGRNEPGLRAGTGSSPSLDNPRTAIDRDDRVQRFPTERQEAANELVSRFYETFLRREASSIDGDFVTRVMSEGRRGIEEVAGAILGSNEFRTAALNRVAERNGSGSRAQLMQRLLEEIYRDLYGFETPDARTSRDDLQRLDDCMGGTRSIERACSDFAVRLLDRRAFYEKHRDVIDPIRRESSWRQSAWRG